MERYETGARSFLTRYGLTLTTTPGDKAAKWSPAGQHYAVVLTRGVCAVERLAFDFWGSQRDKEEGRAASAYDVLACLSSDASMPEDPDEVAAEYGPMKPSEAYAVADFGKRIRAFFTAAELEALAEIN